MSGSGGGGGSGVDIGDSSCDSLRFDAQLTSPRPAVVNILQVNAVLDIVVANMNGQLVVQVLHKSQVAGGLAGPDAARLRNCIDQGHTYTATVRSINQGQVRVRVEHV